MMPVASRLRAASQLARLARPIAQRAPLSTSAARCSSGSKAPAAAVPSEPRTTDPNAQPTELMQAPNRAGIWASGQRPRSEAMTGPRFEQTNFSVQPQPPSAMELAHKQPVRWTHDRIVACDGEGGGGPGGHPRIFINTDKPEICTCNYCGLPYANEHHRKQLEALPQTSYPLA